MANCGCLLYILIIIAAMTLLNYYYVHPEVNMMHVLHVLHVQRHALTGQETLCPDKESHFNLL